MMWYSTRFLPVKHNTQLKFHPYKRSITVENMYTFVQEGKDLKHKEVKTVRQEEG